jgi:hypothetical protein
MLPFLALSNTSLTSVALWWEWIPASERALAHADTTHTRRNFEEIWQWAKDHELEGDFDSHVHVTGHGGHGDNH